MTTKALYKALDTRDLTGIIKNGRRIKLVNLKNTIEWTDQDGLAVCVVVRRKGDLDNIVSDDFAGVRPISIKGAVKVFNN